MVLQLLRPLIGGQLGVGLHYLLAFLMEAELPFEASDSLSAILRGHSGSSVGGSLLSRAPGGVKALYRRREILIGFVGPSVDWGKESCRGVIFGKCRLRG